MLPNTVKLGKLPLENKGALVENNFVFETYC